MSASMIDPLLCSVRESVLSFVEAQLANNRIFDDGELHAMFVANGLSVLQASQALRYRRLYLDHVYLRTHTPIRSNKHALRLNPQLQQFESLTS